MKRLWLLAMFILLNKIALTQYVYIWPLENNNSCGSVKVVKFVIRQGGDCESMLKEGINECIRSRNIGVSNKSPWDNCGKNSWSAKGNIIVILSRNGPDSKCSMRTWGVGFGNNKAEAMKNAKGYLGGFDQGKDVVEYSGDVGAAIADPTLKYKD